MPSTYTKSHREYYQRNREAILKKRKEEREEYKLLKEMKARGKLLTPSSH